VIDGNLDEQLPLVVLQTHTQADLNLNGEIGNRANALLGGELGSKSPVQQNDRVDIRRPSNDSLPTETHVAAVRHIVSDLVAASELHRARRGKEKAFTKTVKIGHAPSDHAARLESGTKRLALAVTELSYRKTNRTARFCPCLRMV
jgi:fumarate hydratase class II